MGKVSRAKYVFHITICFSIIYTFISGFNWKNSNKLKIFTWWYMPKSTWFLCIYIYMYMYIYICIYIHKLCIFKTKEVASMIKDNIAGAFRGKVNLSVKLKILEFLLETYFMTITNPWNVSKRVLTSSFTYFESIMVELALSITNQSANRNFSSVLNSYNVLCNHTSSHVFLPQYTCKLSKFII